jgi:son of sevenless
MPLPPPPQTAPLYDKPVPPLPSDANRPRAGSENRVRRQPVLLDDSATLAGLSALIEGTDTKEFQQYPDLARRVSSKRSRGNSTRTPVEYHPNTKPRNDKPVKIHDKPWYILPAHASELDVDVDGTIRGGSLLALVELLTSEAAFKGPRSKHLSGTSSARKTLILHIRIEQLFRISISDDFPHVYNVREVVRYAAGSIFHDEAG